MEATSEHLSGESDIHQVIDFDVAFSTQPTEMTTTSGSVIIYTSYYEALFTVGSSSSDDTIVIVAGVLSILSLVITVSIFIAIYCLFRK